MMGTLLVDVTGIHIGGGDDFIGGYSACLTTNKTELIDFHVFIADTREQAVKELKEHYTEGIRNGDPNLSLDDAFHIFLMQNKLKV